MCYANEYNSLRRNNKSYAWLRRRFSESQSADKIGKKGHPAWNKGVPCTEETKNKISASLIGKSPTKGQPKSAEHRQKMSENKKGKSNVSIKGIPKTAEHKQKLSGAKKGKSKSNEHKNKLKEHLSNLSDVQCPYCNKIGKTGPMHRWHFDKCRYR